MNTFSGKDQLSNMSVFDVSQSGASSVSNAETAMATCSLPASDVIVTAVKTASCISLSRVQSPNVFTGYPVLTLPLRAGSPHHRSSPARSPLTPSPRKLHSSPSPRRQLSASKTPLKGQMCIDQVFKPISSPAASLPPSASVTDSSSLPLSGQTVSSEIQSCLESPCRKWIQPDEISVSPLLSRNCEHFVTLSAPKDLQSADVSGEVGLSRSEDNCNSAVVQGDNCSVDAVTSTEANPVRQSFLVDAVIETSTVENTQVTATEVQMKNSTVSSLPSSAGCSNDTVSPKSADKKTAISWNLLKIPAVKLQRMQEVLEKSMLARAKSAKICSSDDASSAAPIVSSPSVTSTPSTVVNNMITNCEVASAAVSATSDTVHIEVSTSEPIVSSQESSSAVGSKVNDITACQPVNIRHINQQTVISHDVQCNRFETAAKVDVLHTDSSAGDGRLNTTAGCKHPDSSLGDRQTVPDNSTKTSSVSAANEVEPRHVVGYIDGKDSQMDVAEDSDEFLYAPIESIPSVLTFFSEHKLDMNQCMGLQLPAVMIKYTSKVLIDLLKPVSHL